MTDSIWLEGIGKQYRIGVPRPAYRSLGESLTNAVTGLFRRTPHSGDRAGAFWALRDIDLTVRAGEVLGLIGRNGAGKSTLLKVLARVTRPTTGRAELVGRVGSLLEVGTGFHSELTGRENVLLNGSILGMKRREILSKMDRIVEFAGVAEFLDTPIKHYSSGMRVRLAFAVAAHLETEILLADEVLAVGDAEFQKRCIEEMGSLARRGRTVVFVSHNMTAIGDVCSRAVLLDHGRLAAEGRPEEVIRKYLGRFAASAAEVALEPPATDHGVALRRIAVANETGQHTTELDWRGPVVVEIEFAVTAPLPALSVGITLVNQLGVRVVHSWALFQAAMEAGTYVVRGVLPGERLNPGRYFIDVGAGCYGIEYYHVAEQAVGFEVVKTSGDYGYDLEAYAATYARLPWEVRKVAG